ncbi:MAG: hypothetical protein Fur0034_00790 [Desulfuromonadia bacterium]
MTGRKFHILLLIPLILVATHPLYAAPPPLRPLTGIGVLTREGGESPTLTLYHHPGREQITQLSPSAIRHLNPVIPSRSETIILAVSRKEGEWYSIFFDDSEREGWVRLGTGWRFIPWDQFLVGRQGCFLPGTPAPLVTLARPDAPGNTPLSRNDRFRIVHIHLDRAFVILSDGRSGWIRWRDREGRFTITLSSP